MSLFGPPDHNSLFLSKKGGLVPTTWKTVPETISLQILVLRPADNKGGSAWGRREDRTGERRREEGEKEGGEVR